MPEFSRNFQILSPGGFSFKKDDIKVLMKCGMGGFCFLKTRKSIFQDITQVIVIKQTIEHDF